MTREELIGRLRWLCDELVEDEWTWNMDDPVILDQAILILEHISPREYARCLEIAGKKREEG